MQAYDFVTSDDGRRGGAKYRVIGKDVVFRQDFAKGFGPGTRDIMIWNGDGRWARMKFVSCRCYLLCHWPGDTSDAQVKITEGKAASSEFKYIIEFAPIIKTGIVSAQHTYTYTTFDDQGRQGGTKYQAIGQDVVFVQALRPESGNIVIRNGDGRWATMKFVLCKCFKLCHQPGDTSDAQVKIRHDPRAAEFKFTIEFLPCAGGGLVPECVKSTVFVAQGVGAKQGGAKYEVIGVSTETTQDPVTGDIIVRNGDGRWALMDFDKNCGCPMACHHLGNRSDDIQVQVEEHDRQDAKRLTQGIYYTINFPPANVAALP
jgi:hypothetical protein